MIDVQKGFLDPYWGRRNNPDAEKNIFLLLDHFRRHGLPVVHIQHLSLEKKSPLRPGQTGSEFMDLTSPKWGERIFQKTVNSAFIGTGLESYLRQVGINHLSIVGLTTDHCVSTTTRMAANLGFQVDLIDDATATFDRKATTGEWIPAEVVHQVSLASLSGEFAQVFSTQGFISSLDGAESPRKITPVDKFC